MDTCKTCEIKMKEFKALADELHARCGVDESALEFNHWLLSDWMNRLFEALK